MVSMCLQSRWFKGVFVLGSTCPDEYCGLLLPQHLKGNWIQSRDFQSPSGPAFHGKASVAVSPRITCFPSENIPEHFSKVPSSVVYYFKLKLQKQGKKLSLHSGFLPLRITRSHPRTDTIFIHLSYFLIFYGHLVLFYSVVCLFLS